MTEEPHSPHPQNEAPFAADMPAEAGEKGNAQPKAAPAGSQDMQAEPRLEEIQAIPCGRIRRWDDGEITVSLGEFYS